jgi:TetR/AcrR family transcriptional regulator, tetracycline repressor protein
MSVVVKRERIFRLLQFEVGTAYLNTVHLNAVHYSRSVFGSSEVRPASGRHTRDDVAATALRILDQFGLPDLTMRRLASALDVQPGALYWHFPNKQALIAELADRIVAPAQLSANDGQGWEERIRATAARLRDALLAYRDGTEVVTSTLALGLGSIDLIELFAAPISHGGFDPQTTRRASTALVHLVLGHVAQEQQRLQYDSLGVVADGAVPADAGREHEADDSFTFGVALLIGGLTATEPDLASADPLVRDS